MSYHWAGVTARGILKKWPWGDKVPRMARKFIKRATRRWQRQQGKKVEGL
jgi:hypothetical protein